MFFGVTAGKASGAGLTINGMTLIDFQTGSGSWDNRYYLTNETLSVDGDYIEFAVSEISSGCGFGVSPTTTGAVAGVWKVWSNTPNVVHILLGGAISATYAIPFELFDRFRVTKSGGNIVFSRNGVNFHTTAQAGVLYGYAGSHDGTSSVNIHAINGVAPSTRSSLNCTVTPGIPSDDFFASNAAFYFSALNWIGVGRYRESSQPGAYFKTQFTGTRAGLICDNTGSNAVGPEIKTWIAVRIDGGLWTRIELTNPTQSYVELASGLSNSTHLIEVMISDTHYGMRINATNRYASVFAYGLRLPAGETISSPPVSPITIMGLGDSNSEGAESLGVRSYTEAGYPKLIADALGVELSQSSAPGQGWQSTPAGGILTVQNGWDLHIDGSSKLTTGALIPEPSAIFICHGQNDSTDVTAAATQVINEMLAATTATKIVVMCPVGRSRRTELMAVVTSIANARVLFFDNPNDFLTTHPTTVGVGPHLSPLGQRLFADIMIEQFANLLSIPVTIGGEVSRVDGDILHTFNASGSFVVAGGPLTIPTDGGLLVGGGAAGGGMTGGGGGAGRVKKFSGTLAVGTYPVVIGLGGLGASTSMGEDGGNSTFNGIVAPGGGGGAVNNQPGRPGGSGGGGSTGGAGGAAVAGAGVTGLGSAGGTGANAGDYPAGGGGGAMGPGQTQSPSAIEGAAGGPGYLSSISGVAKYYGGGGGGGTYTGTIAGLGGSGVGGNGGMVSDPAPTAGAPNTGSGGGGTGQNQANPGGNGGSGVMHIRYPG